ncbi:MAG: hypothetical protein JO307_34195 [Bryobacterales bacterium]|nr:hypothetical protein [Bryobacterales bacterium]MBV9401661.1 hypothetical protein [Bryobacterales bacterium]
MILRLQEAPTGMNVQIAHVVSDLGGVTGMANLDAVLEGERDRYKLADLADPRIKANRVEIAKSLEDNWRPDLLFVLRQQRDLYRDYQRRIRECDQAIQEHMKTLEG